jgi:hypothetical protein
MTRGRTSIGVLVAAMLAGDARSEPRHSITVEPVSLLMTTTFGVQLEREIVPRVGVALLAGGGRSTRVAIGDRIHTYAIGTSEENAEDISYGRIHLGAAGSYYAERFRGGHVTGELVYVHYGWARPDRADIDVLSGSAYAGWKWLIDHDITFVLQAGIGLVMTHGEDPMEDGFRFERDGTLGPIHLAANGLVGWSF